MMSEWSEVFKTSGLREMIVKDGVTGRVLYHGTKKKRGELKWVI